MPLFDQERMVKLVSEHRKSIGRLQALSKLGQEEFLSDPDKIGSAKYHFIVAIETCIDMCNHVISRNGYRVPEDYGDTFKVMKEVGAFDTDFSEELKNMARFRNRLVHLYWEVDDGQLFDILQSRLDDFKKFLDSMAEFLEWQNQKPAEL
jgi:uncharacterized protein YutE (UPF0331/DUF86 family)